MSTREAEKKALRAMLIWAALSVILGVEAAGSSRDPLWLRVLVGLCALLFAFLAGLVAIPNEKPPK